MQFEQKQLYDFILYDIKTESENEAKRQKEREKANQMRAATTRTSTSTSTSTSTYHSTGSNYLYIDPPDDVGPDDIGETYDYYYDDHYDGGDDELF